MGASSFETSQGPAAFSPLPVDSFRKNGVVPDIEGLIVAARLNFPVLYRVAGAQPWQTRSALDATRKVLAAYPGIAAAAPSGEIALGYPDMKPLAALLKEYGVAGAMVEFSRQQGASQLNASLFPSLLPLHSVTHEELLARNINRVALRERFVRAVAERGIRLLVLRPPVSGNAEDAVNDFGNEVEWLATELEARGFHMSWPKPAFTERPGGAFGFLAVWPCAGIFLLTLSRYLKRMTRRLDEPVDFWEVLFFGLLSLLLAGTAWKVGAVSRWIGAFTAAFVVVEASLISMDNPKRFLRALLGGFLFALVGGMALAALFSVPLYLLRLKVFSGVKLTLTLPLLLVVLHDMRRRVHPESLSGFFSRPPIWGELVLGVFLLGLLGIVLFRSDNVQFIPGLEAQVRNALERLLVARPRNKEVFVGYPAFLLYIYAVNSGLWARYREILRLGTVLGFSSVVNSFCHFHTPLLFILLREFHGLWFGVLLGIAVVAVTQYLLLPLWRRTRFVTE